VTHSLQEMSHLSSHLVVVVVVVVDVDVVPQSCIFSEIKTQTLFFFKDKDFFHRRF
jgi:hypothetical protein